MFSQFIDESCLQLDELKPSDFGELHELLTMGVGHFGYPTDATGGLGRDTSGYIYRQLDHPEQTVACRYDGRLIGFMNYAWGDRSQTCLVVRNVFVHPAFRDGLVLFAMYQALLEDDDPQCRTIVATTEPSNRPAITAARKLGFMYLPRRPRTLISHIPLVLNAPLVAEFFATRGVDDSEYFFYLHRPALSALGQRGDEEIWDGRPVCRYCFVVESETLEAIVDLSTGELTAILGPDRSCALRAGSEGRETALEMWNGSASNWEGHAAIASAGAAHAPMSSRFSISPGGHASISFQRNGARNPRRHAAIVSWDSQRIALAAGYSAPHVPAEQERYAALRDRDTTLRYDRRSDRLQWFDARTAIEYARIRWTEAGPPYWEFEDGTDWTEPRVEVAEDQRSFTVARSVRNTQGSLERRACAVGEGVFRIDYSPRGALRFGCLIEFLLPHPVITYGEGSARRQIVPVHCELPNRFHPLRPSQPWLEVDSRGRRLKLDWTGASAAFFADVDSLKLLLEFTGAAPARLTFSSSAEPAPERREPARPWPETVAAVHVDYAADSSRIANGALACVVSGDARAPVTSLFALGREWLDCAYPAFSARGRDPEWCGGLGLRVSTGLDAVGGGEWVRDFGPPEHHDGSEWAGIARTGSLENLALPHVRVSRRFLMPRHDAPIMCIETHFENAGDETAAFASKDVLAPAGADSPEFLLQGWSGLGIFERRRVEHEALASSRGALVCGTRDHWLAFASPEGEAIAYDQGRFGLNLDARRRHSIAPGACDRVRLYVAAASQRNAAARLAEQLLTDPAGLL